MSHAIIELRQKIIYEAGEEKPRVQECVKKGGGGELLNLAYGTLHARRIRHGLLSNLSWMIP